MKKLKLLAVLVALLTMAGCSASAGVDGHGAEGTIDPQTPNISGSIG